MNQVRIYLAPEDKDLELPPDEPPEGAGRMVLQMFNKPVQQLADTIRWRILNG